ncbi:unnamed protein product, partial [Ectocarpus sp. 12 AP-2014]
VDASGVPVPPRQRRRGEPRNRHLNSRDGNITNGGIVTPRRGRNVEHQQRPLRREERRKMPVSRGPSGGHLHDNNGEPHGRREDAFCRARGVRGAAEDACHTPRKRRCSRGAGGPRR